ncbi:DUF6274 family protein [Streptomyces albus subsp. chlorinus]|uniref:DUF6274 family protein n=1 Tax=Streptomyces albus TaxID=1888 RepID=UPI00156FB12A|nr:DUF6274 family protein [Streptomyces albus]
MAGFQEAVRAEARVLLRTHLAAAGRRRHARRHCPVCHRLLRLALAGGPLRGARTRK